MNNRIGIEWLIRLIFPLRIKWECLKRAACITNGCLGSSWLSKMEMGWVNFYKLCIVYKSHFKAVERSISALVCSPHWQGGWLLHLSMGDSKPRLIQFSLTVQIVNHTTSHLVLCGWDSAEMFFGSINRHMGPCTTSRNEKENTGSVLTASSPPRTISAVGVTTLCFIQTWEVANRFNLSSKV
jgi:hypothetical protein